MLVIHILFYIVAFLLFVYPLGAAYITGNRWLNHKALHKQPVFWVAVMWPTSAFLLFGSEVWFSYELSTTEAGYAKFLDISKLPLGILASGLAAAAFVASIHRSIQTAKQIEEAKVKNTADLYYAHLRFFMEQLKDNDVVDSAIKLHRNLYPFLTPSNYNIKKNHDVLNKIDSFHTCAINSIDSYEHHTDPLKALKELTELSVPDGLTTAYIKLTHFNLEKKNNNSTDQEFMSLGFNPLQESAEAFSEYVRKIESIYNLARI